LKQEWVSRDVGQADEDPSQRGVHQEPAPRDHQFIQHNIQEPVMLAPFQSRFENFDFRDEANSKRALPDDGRLQKSKP